MKVTAVLKLKYFQEMEKAGKFTFPNFLKFFRFFHSRSQKYGGRKRLDLEDLCYNQGL